MPGSTVGRGVRSDQCSRWGTALLVHRLQVIRRVPLPRALAGTASRLTRTACALVRVSCHLPPPTLFVRGSPPLMSSARLYLRDWETLKLLQSANQRTQTYKRSAHPAGLDGVFHELSALYVSIPLLINIPSLCKTRSDIGNCCSLLYGGLHRLVRDGSLSQVAGKD